MSNQEESPSILKALADLHEGHHPLAMSILAEMEIMRQVEVYCSLATDKIDDVALQNLYKTISDNVVSGVDQIVSSGYREEMRTGPSAVGNAMEPGQVLRPGTSIRSGEFAFTFGNDGELVLSQLGRGSIFWRSGTRLEVGKGLCILEENGNLAIYDPDGNAIWSSGTWQHPGSRLVLSENGAVQIRRPNPAGPDPYIIVWETNRFLGDLKMFHASGPAAAHPETTLTVPEGWKILGGGARVNWSQPGNLLTASFPKDAQTWVAKAKDHRSSSPANIDVWAIAIYDPFGDRCDIDIFSAESAADNHPCATATVPEGYILTGGGAQANWKGAGSLLTASYPEDSRHWVAASKDHIDAEKATITAYAIGIRAGYRAPSVFRTIFERNMFETRIFTNTGTSANWPSAEISAPGYVIVGGGAKVNWQNAGNLLTASYPEQSTWKVASKDLEIPESCTITAYAIGARVGSGPAL